MGPSTVLDPNIYYAIKIDNTADDVEDLMLMVHATGTGGPGGNRPQQIQIAGPYKPNRTGTVIEISNVPYDMVAGSIGVPFTTSKGMHVYAGAAEDPSFIDLNALFSVFPDRANGLGPTFTNSNGVSVSTTPADPNAPQLASFRSSSQAQDFFKGTNIMAIVIELPRASLGGHVIRAWGWTGDAACLATQVDRTARPLANLLFAPVARNREMVNATDTPVNDQNQLLGDIKAFIGHAAGRSQAVTTAVGIIFSPDVLIADLSQTGPAGYLGVETGGAIGTKFGGRALTDDVADTLFGIVFGNTLPRTNLAPDDGKETPGLTTDNVGSTDKHYQSAFPYLGPPQ
jgi:hypothetical protein